MIAQGLRQNSTETPSGERGFSMTELMIAMMVFTLIMGSVIALLTKSQKIFRTEQGVSEMDQNARLMIDFLTRDIQQAKENGLGLGEKFRSIYSYNGPEGKTDEVTIVSSDTETEMPSAALPLVAASSRPFNASERYVEVLPNGQGLLEPGAVVDSIKPDEEFIISSTLPDGSVQFDFIKVTNARMTNEGTVGLSFDTVQHSGVEPVVPYESLYENGAFSLRPVTIKRYFIDRENDKEHPTFALSVNDNEPITIARNVVAFQLRYLELQDGEVEGQWVKEQSIESDKKTLAIEVTLTARTEVKDDPDAERLITLASVIRPRNLPDGTFGSSNGTRNPGLPGGPGGGSGGDPDGGGPGGGFPGGPGGGGPGGPGGPGGGWDDGGGGSGGGPWDGDGGPGGDGWNRRSRRIGKPPRLGERLNPRP